MKISNKNVAVWGSGFGDESKARVVHQFAKDFDVIIRTGGSGNAGHTIYHKGTKIVRHLVPSADFSTNNLAFLSSCMVINPEELLSEIKYTLKLFPNAAKSIVIDPDAFVVFQKHIDEDKEKNKHIGSTNKGVGPAYRDKIGRVGTKLRTLINDNAPVISAIKELGVKFQYVSELRSFFEEAKLLFEGSQSILLDYNFAAYPYCTSGQCSIAGIIDGGFAFAMPEKNYGICKPYLTKSGNGPMPTEYGEEESKLLREKGEERGNTTGRDRRIGALDLPSLMYSIEKGGLNSLIFSKLDILNGHKTIKVCTAYDKPMYCGSDLMTVKPTYIDLPGWEDAKNIEQIKPFISYVESFTGLTIEYVSSGVNPEDMVKLK